MYCYEKRQCEVRCWLNENRLDAIVVSSPSNVRYLSGFTGEGHLVLTRDGGAICTDGRYKVQAHDETEGLAIELSSNGHLGGVIEYLTTQHSELCSFDEQVVTYAGYRKLCSSLGEASLRPGSGVIEQLRMVKEEAEIAQMRAAAAIVDAAFDSLVDELTPGMTERDVAFELDRRILQGGADGIAFNTIVAAGPSAACPHATPGSRKLTEGDMVKFDVGARLNGYCSDMTRTVFLGDPDEKLRAVYGTVKRAQQAACAAVRVGALCSDLDALAREIIADAGYGENFVHSLGHGVGLDVHELPHLSSRSTTELQAGMVVTVEPGIYIEGWGGVRIEDLVVVRAGDCEVLTQTPKAECFG